MCECGTQQLDRRCAVVIHLHFGRARVLPATSVQSSLHFQFITARPHVPSNSRNNKVIIAPQLISHIDAAFVSTLEYLDWTTTSHLYALILGSLEEDGIK